MYEDMKKELQKKYPDPKKNKSGCTNNVVCFEMGKDSKAESPGNFFTRINKTAKD